MSGEEAIFNLQIKKKSGLSLNPDIHHSKVFSSDYIKSKTWLNCVDIDKKNLLETDKRQVKAKPIGPQNLWGNSHDPREHLWMIRI